MLADGKYISYRVTHSIDRSLRSFFGIENKPQVILIKVESLVYCRPNYPGIIRRIVARNFRPCISAFDQSSLAIGIEVIADSVALKFIVLFQGYTREFRNVMSIKELKTLVGLFYKTIEEICWATHCCKFVIFWNALSSSVDLASISEFKGAFS